MFQGLPHGDWLAVRKCVIAAIMATDMGQHKHHIDSLRGRHEDGKAGPIGSSQTDRMLLCRTAMKCADLSHLIRPFPVACAWEELLCTEFFMQGDMEADRGLSVTPSMNRQKLDVPTSQVRGAPRCWHNV